MSGNYKVLIVSSLVFLITGCSGSFTNVSSQKPKSAKEYEYFQSQEEIKCLKPKVNFEEYKNIIYALYYESVYKFDKAYEIFEKLYRDTGKLDYLLEALKLATDMKKFDKAKSLAEEGIKKFPGNERLEEFLTVLYLKEADFKKAKDLALKLLKKSKTQKRYEYLAVAYLGLADFKNAAKYYKKAYEIDQNEIVLRKLVTILSEYLDKKKEAVSLLEKHIKKNGCSHIVCTQLVDIYLKDKNIEGVISTYKKLYEKTGEKIYLERIVELYVYQNEPKKAITYILATGDNEDLLIELYIKIKDYKKALEVAKSSYEKYGSSEMLARVAILEYESAKIKSDKLIKDVSLKFEKAFKDLEESANKALYYNYYGYLLIDHDIDIKKGIEYVKKALKIEPDSVYYLDSLAWGYYKLGKCEKAYEIMDKIIDRTDEDEIIGHYKKIKECLKGKK